MDKSHAYFFVAASITINLLPSGCSCPECSKKVAYSWEIHHLQTSWKLIFSYIPEKSITCLVSVWLWRQWLNAILIAKQFSQTIKSLNKFCTCNIEGLRRFIPNIWILNIIEWKHLCKWIPILADTCTWNWLQRLKDWTWE